MIRFYDSQMNEQQCSCISRKKLILNGDIWNTGRCYFEDYFNVMGEMTPVFNDEHQLICYAWQDKEANRQLRMLDELCSCADALNFKDIYPEIESVTIQGCNELAYYFMKYLEEIGIPVFVMGGFWDELGVDRKIETIAKKNLTIYAEGVEVPENNIRIRRSVSAEFECIDRIYEANILQGKIKDTADGYEDDGIAKRLNGKTIGILEAGIESLNAYDLLLGYGVDISFFISDEKDIQGNMIYGKKVISLWEARKKYENLVFIDACSKYSAWGFGETDFYDYLGYKRNQSFFLLRDYMEIEHNGLQNILNCMIKQSDGRLVLAGDIWLCQRMKQILEIGNFNRVIDINVLENHGNQQAEINDVSKYEICEKDIGLVILPEYYGNQDDPQKNRLVAEMKNRYLSRIISSSVRNVEIYDFDNEFIKRNEKQKASCREPLYKVKTILIGASNGFSGNKFFRDLLDSHPDIVMLDWSSLNNNLFLLCMRLSMVKGANILDLFWKLCEEQKGYPDENFEEDFPKKEIFNQYMRDMLMVDETFTSQELFVMIHVAYAKMWGKEIGDIRNACIYWEPHFVPRNKCEGYAVWLEEVCDYKYIVNIVRNACMSAGSYLKLLNRLNIFSYNTGVFAQIFKYFNEEKKEYEGWNRITLRFEDLKCKPKEELSVLCNKLDIAWSDSLLETTVHGKVSSLWGVTGFDLKPVYNIYEEFFSSFDRFRITLITASWQKQYDYPYVDNLDFSRRQLQEMFLKEFRFERDSYRNYEEKKKIREEVQKMISICLQMNRRNEILERGEQID